MAFRHMLLIKRTVRKRKRPLSVRRSYVLDERRALKLLLMLSRGSLRVGPWHIAAARLPSLSMVSGRFAAAEPRHTRLQ